MSENIDIKDLLKEELIARLAPLGAQSFRADQILKWVYKRYVSDFGKMTDLSEPLRIALKEKFYISTLKEIGRQRSKDGTEKVLFALADGQKIETVFIPSKSTDTVCVSSQAGCSLACLFCASGKKGFARDLKAAEIVNQVLFLKAGGLNVTNIVFMGMGEPMDNYDNVLKAVRILNAPWGLGIGQRKITISTCGIIPGIKKLSQEGMQIELSVSLHSAEDKKRSVLMPVNKKFPLKELMSACKQYIKVTNRQVTFEYILLSDFNDTAKDAECLAVLIKGMLAKVNLITFNPTGPSVYIPSPPQAIKLFKALLDKKGIIATIRASRGSDIDGACGQLRLRDGV